ncbi:hypothetical protein [Serratia symbiotica]|nr:hypothetical protein [Serratia symbiotica]
MANIHNPTMALSYAVMMPGFSAKKAGFVYRCRQVGKHQAASPIR